MDDDILDIDADDIIVKETQNDQFSLATCILQKTYSKICIRQHNHGNEAINNNQNGSLK